MKHLASWRTSLGIDIMTSGGWDVTFEYNHDEVDQAVSFLILVLERTGTLADGRGTYDGKGIYQLTNDTKVEPKLSQSQQVKILEIYNSMRAIPT